jgi:hypothetical protein
VKTCNDLVVEIYQDAKINNLIAKIKPTELQEDLKQELMLILLEMNCSKLKELKQSNSLLHYVIRIITNMAMSNNSPFFYKYKKSDTAKLLDYIRSQSGFYPIHLADIAKKDLEKKLTSNANEAHESMIFSKYVEIRNCQKVADFFGVPHKHVFDVVKKTKNHLKTIIKKEC